MAVQRRHQLQIHQLPAGHSGRRLSGCTGEMMGDEGKHVWFEFHGLTCCAKCGIVRRRDDKNKPCKGRISIALRAAKITADAA